MRKKKYDLIFGILLILWGIGYLLLPTELWSSKLFIGIYTFLLMIISTCFGFVKRKATNKERKNELDAIVKNNGTETLRRLLKRSTIIFTIMGALFAFCPVVSGITVFRLEWWHWILSAASVLSFGIAVKNFCVYRKLRRAKNIEKCL